MVFPFFFAYGNWKRKEEDSECSVVLQIKFMIAEARETCVPTKDMDLEMRPNDRLIVIDGRLTLTFNRGTLCCYAVVTGFREGGKWE